MVKTDLQKLGLSKNESEIYVALLQLKNASSVDVAKKTGIPKSTIDSTFPKLIQKGFIKVYLKNSRKRYAAIDPKVFTENAEAQLQTTKAVMPQLHALFGNTNERPVVEFYEGENGLKAVLKTILDEASELKGLASPDSLFGILPTYFPTFTKKRVENKIPLQMIFSDSKMAHERKATDAQSLRTSKIVDKSMIFDSLIFMWNEKTAIITYDKDISVLVIKNESATKTFRSMFQSIWNFQPEVS